VPFGQHGANNSEFISDYQRIAALGGWNKETPGRRFFDAGRNAAARCRCYDV
jgi:hypothetical protein